MSSREPPQAPPPSLPSKYTFVRKLGQGGMGSVYLFHHNELDIDVAIKVISPEFATDASLTERFKQEATLLARLSHENITKIFEMDSFQDQLYIVMEYVPGRPLREFLSAPKLRKRYFSVIRDALLKVHSAISYLSSCNVVHRDLKPENIILHPSTGTVKVLDFGLSKLLVDSQGLTRTGQLLGTPAYMAPEQVTGVQVTPATDMYAFGVIVYEFLTGISPFAKSSLSDSMRAIVSGELVPARSIHVELPQETSYCLDRLICSAPEERFSWYESLKDHLANVSTGHEDSLCQLNETISISNGGAGNQTLLTHRPTNPNNSTNTSYRAQTRLRINKLSASAVAIVLCACIAWFALIPRKPTMNRSAPSKATEIPTATPSGEPRPQSASITELLKMERVIESEGSLEGTKFATLKREDYSGDWLIRYRFCQVFFTNQDITQDVVRDVEALAASTKARLVLERTRGIGALASLATFLLKCKRKANAPQLLNRVISVGAVRDVQFACSLYLHHTKKGDLSLKELSLASDILKARSEEATDLTSTCADINLYLSKRALSN